MSSLEKRKYSLQKLGQTDCKWAEWTFAVKGSAEARQRPLFELVVWLFFIECVWQKDNTLSRRSIHLRFQVAPGEFNLKSVGWDTLVINQLHPRVCLSGCVFRAICLCPCVINHCLFLYRTHNGWVSFSQLKINSSWSDSLTIAGWENKIVLRQPPHTVSVGPVSDCCCTVETAGGKRESVTKKSC